MPWHDVLFFIAFLGQIYLISYHYPERLLARMQKVLTEYPPSEYPRLYPKPIEHYRLAHWVFKTLSRLVLALGFVFVVCIAFLVDHSTFADDGFISEAFPLAYGMIQFVPLFLLEMSEFRHFKLMREANTATRRRADLRPRRLFDFVSPRLVASAVMVLFASSVFDLWVHGFDVSWGHSTVQRILWMCVLNLGFLLVGIWHLQGKKLDPHQAIEDRARRIGVSLKSLLFVSMVVSVFFGLSAADDVYSMDFLDATLMSLYLQVVVFLSIGYLLREFRLDDVEFGVYRDEVCNDPPNLPAGCSPHRAVGGEASAG